MCVCVCMCMQTADGASVLGGFGFEGYGSDGKVIGWDGVRAHDGGETPPMSCSRGGGIYDL